MKKLTAKLISRTTEKVAKRSAAAGCDWKFYQPKVPAKLKIKK